MTSLPSPSQPFDCPERRAFERASSHLARYVGCIPLAGPQPQCLSWDGVARRWYRQVGGAAMHLREPTLLQELRRLEKEGCVVQGEATRYVALTGAPRQPGAEKNATGRLDRAWRSNRAPAYGRRAATTERRPAPRYGPNPRSSSPAGAAGAT